MEETVLLPERLVTGKIAITVRFLGALLHIGVCDLRDSRQEENPSEYEYEAGNGKVYPLDVPESRCRVLCVLEEGVRSQDGAYNGSYGIESLRKVDTELGVLGRSTN